MSLGPLEPEDILKKASQMSKFHMDPNYFLQYVKKMEVEEVELDGWEVIDWRCEAYAFGKRVPCLPSGLSSGNPKIISKINYPTPEGSIVFKGEVLPKVEEVVETPSITLPEDWEEAFVKAMVEGDYFAKVEVSARRNSKAYVKRGDDVCVATYYQSFWYGTAHNATALAILTSANTKRTLIFLPYLAEDVEPALEGCSAVYLLEGIGSCKGMSREGGILKIGCKGPWFGSPFDTPDKVDVEILRTQLEVIWALLT